MASFGSGTVKRSVKIKDWVDTKFVPVMGKISNQKHLNALRDGFMLLLPLIIASTVAVLLRSTLFGGNNSEKGSLLGVFAVWSGAPQDATTGSHFLINNVLTNWGRVSDEATLVLNGMYKFGLDLLTIYFAFSFGFCLAKIRGNSTPEIAGLVSLGCFMVATLGGQSSASFIDLSGKVQSLGGDFKGSSGIFTAIITTIISIEVFCWLSNIKSFELKMTGVPPAVARSFAKLYPAFGAAVVISLLLAVVAIPTHLTNAAMLSSQTDANGQTVVGVSQAAQGSFYNFGDAVYMAIQAPFIYVASINNANFGISVFVCFLVGFFWFFGIHGVLTIYGIFFPVYLVLLQNNIGFLAQGPEVLKAQGSIFIFSSFGSFIWLGGSMATLPLIISSLIFSKNKAEKEIAKFSAPAGIFQINEPVIFGYPLVGNFRYVIPTIFLMPILAVSTWVFYQAFDTAKPTATVPLTMPVGLGSLFITNFDWTAFIIFVINFVIAFAVWTPFVILASRAQMKEELKKKASEAQSKISEAKI